MSHALKTDRYELAMLGAYLKEGIAEKRAVFELYLRKLPAHRRYLVVCGISRILDYVKNLRFNHREIEYLSRVGSDWMTPAVAKCLSDFYFKGDIDGMTEGEMAFGGEPIIRVSGTLAEAQLLETFMLGVINHECKVASKASRIVEAAQGKPVFEFGARRIDPEMAHRASRAAYIAGCVSTSCEEAGFLYDIPVSGTCAHSYMLAHVDDGEAGAFQKFTEAFSGGTTLLIDTYDTLNGALLASQAGPGVKAVRLDSGDLLALGPQVRSILDNAGREDVKIVASDDMDEYKIAKLIEGKAPYDSFGVGTAIVLSPDSPSFGAVYKLVEIEDKNGKMVSVAKKAPGKNSYGGSKQVWRQFDNGVFVQDVVGLSTEQCSGEKLLKPLIRRGDKVVGFDTEEARDFLSMRKKEAPEFLLRITPDVQKDHDESYRVVISDMVKGQ